MKSRSTMGGIAFMITQNAPVLFPVVTPDKEVPLVYFSEHYSCRHASAKGLTFWNWSKHQFQKSVKSDSWELTIIIPAL